MAFVAEFIRTIGDRREVTPYAITQRLLLARGILDVPLIVREGRDLIPVLVYARGDARDAAHFASAVEAAREWGAPGACYYAPKKLASASAGQALRPLAFADFASPAAPPPEGEYGVWWPTDDDPEPTKSPRAAAIAAAAKAIAGIESRVLGEILRSSGQRPDNTPILLPPERTAFPVEGPDGIPIEVAVDARGGIRFLLPKAIVSGAWALAFWTNVAALFERYRSAVAGTADRAEPLARVDLRETVSR